MQVRGLDRRLRLAGGLAALAILVGAGLWLVVRGGSRRAVERPRPANVAAEPSSDVGSELGPEEPRRVDVVRTPEVPPIEPPTVLASADAHDLSEEETARIHVTVSLPSDLPADDAPVLFAFYRPDYPLTAREIELLTKGVIWRADPLEELDRRNLPWVGRPLGKSGRVTVPLPRNAGTAFLVIDSRYLRLDPKPVVVSAKVTRVLLQPELGALVTGVCKLPPGARDRGIRPEHFTVSFEPPDQRDQDSVSDYRASAVPLDARYTFEARALSPGSYVVEAWMDDLLRRPHLPVDLQPGEHAHVELPFLLGGTVRGRVTGDDGQPIAQADIHLASNPDGAPTARTDEQGRYELRTIPPGWTRMLARAEGRLNGRGEAFKIQDGEVREEVDFVLGRGPGIRGRVVWPDGQPVPGATVGAFVRKYNKWLHRKDSTQTQVQGEFELGGLTREETCRVRAFFEVRSTRGPASQADPKRWSAVAEDVPAGAHDLRLVLQPPLSVTGKVVDSKGKPLPGSTVVALPGGAKRWSQDRTKKKVSDPQGVFNIDVPYAGSWEFRASAKGYYMPEGHVALAVPESTDVTLTLQRSVRISGMVVDPDGTPAEGASVWITTLPDSPGEGFHSVQSNSIKTTGGKFKTSVTSTRVLLAGAHEDWAKSEELSLDLSAESTVEDLILTLRVGATVHGTLLDAAGEPLAGQRVWIAGRWTRTGEDGGFTVEHVPPGEQIVTATVDESTTPGYSELVTEQVQVAEGQVVKVTLQE